MGATERRKVSTLPLPLHVLLLGVRRAPSATQRERARECEGCRSVKHPELSYERRFRMKQVRVMLGEPCGG
jgi:hypothetical protein